ncbi:MAG: energy transducer TonB [Acidobacteriota bacterium]
MRTSIAIVVFVLGAAVPLAAQQDPLSSARELYASARYDEALATLNSLRGSEDVAVKPAEVRAVEQVRSLCLLALGRASEAQEAIAAVVSVDPFFQPGESDAAPRVRAAFQDVRRRMLPDIATERYTRAKASYDRKDYASASDQFRQVITLLQDPDMQGRLPDLRTLSTGFLELSEAAVKAAEPEKAPEPVTPPPAPLRLAPKVYSADDPDVTAPLSIRQDVPKVPMAIINQVRDRGIIEVVIDELGRVESAAIRSSIHPNYDSMLLAAAADWKYRAATVNGQPVKFRKRIQISVTRRD